MKKILFLLIMISCIMIFVGCATKTGYWKPGTDFDDTLTPEQYSVLTDEEKKLIALKGAVPGAKGGIVFIRNSVKA